MAFVPVPNTLQAELRFLFGSQKCENVLYFTGSGGVTPALATTLGAALVAWWNAQFKAASPTIMSLTEVYLTDLSTATSFTVSYVTGLPSAGSSAVDPLPFNCSHCVSFRTANRGRSGRGRNYVMGLSDSEAVASVITVTRRNIDVNAYAALVGAGTFVAGLQFCVVSRISNGVPRASGLIQPVTAVLSVDDTIDSQRRRLPGRGR